MTDVTWQRQLAGSPDGHSLSPVLQQDWSACPPPVSSWSHVPTLSHSVSQSLSQPVSPAACAYTAADINCPVSTADAGSLAGMPRLAAHFGSMCHTKRSPRRCVAVSMCRGVISAKHHSSSRPSTAPGRSETLPALAQTDRDTPSAPYR